MRNGNTFAPSAKGKLSSGKGGTRKKCGIHGFVTFTQAAWRFRQSPRKSAAPAPQSTAFCESVKCKKICCRIKEYYLVVAGTHSCPKRGQIGVPIPYLSRLSSIIAVSGVYIKLLHWPEYVTKLLPRWRGTGEQIMKKQKFDNDVWNIKKRAEMSSFCCIYWTFIGNGDAHDCVHAQALVCAASS